MALWTLLRALAPICLVVATMACSKKVAVDAELGTLRDEMCACETRACATKVARQFDDWYAEQEAVEQGDNLELVGSYYLCERKNSAYAKREEATDSECKRIARRLVPFLVLGSDVREQSAVRERMASACEKYWGDETRSCMEEVKSVDETLACRLKAVEAECSETFTHLEELVAEAKRIDSSLSAKRLRFVAACRDTLFPWDRTCATDAETLADFKECVEAGFVEELLASEGLGWSTLPIDGLNTWFIHEDYDGVSGDFQAMKLSSNAIERNGRFVRPTLFVSCQGEYLGFHFDDRLMGAREISLPPVGEREVKLRLAIDDEPAEAWDGFVAVRGLTGVGQPAKLVARMRGAKRLVLDVGEASTATFELDDFAKLVSRLEKCLPPSTD